MKEMRITANRPYFCPFPGFFFRAYLSDVWVILDEVQFPLGTTWISRNRFKNHQGTLWLTIPVWKKGLGLQRINEVKICYEGRWRRKHLESLKSAYAHAPYLRDHLAFMEEIFSGKFERLIDLNLAIIRYLLNCLGIDSKIMLQSELGIKSTGTQLLIDICRALGASSFLIPRHAQVHLDLELLGKNGIELKEFKFAALVYPQLWGDFLGNLSTFDLVLNCGPKARELLMQRQPAIG